MSAVVVDASAGVEMALRTTVGLRLEARLPAQATFWVPEHYFVEVAAAFRRLERADTYPAARLQLSFDAVLNQPARRVSVRPLISEAWSLRHNLTIGDATYVVIAEHLDAPLVTADERLANAPTLRVATITP